MPGKQLSRRQFLQTAAGLAAVVALPAGRAPAPGAGEEREYFVAREFYHELPAECFSPNLIRPLEIILHWDGNRHGRELWLAPITFQTLQLLGVSAHFAVDGERAWQMLPMYRTVVQESYGAKGFNWLAINVEMAGRDFDEALTYPPEAEIGRTVRLVSNLMDFYGIERQHVVGHFERDPRGDKLDPGERFMADFRYRLARYRAQLAPQRRFLIQNG